MNNKQAMKWVILTITGVVVSAAQLAAQQTATSLIVKSKTEITFPENPNRGDGDGFNGPSGMESKNTTYYKGDFIKTLNQSDFGNNIVIVDKKNKKTTTLIEAMGRKTGFYITEEDQEKMREDAQKRMDSLRQARGGNDDQQRNFTPAEPEIVYTNETKKIAGYNCKKAIIKTKSRQGEVSELHVWYTPDVQRPEGYPVSGANTGGGGFARGFSGGGPGGGAFGGLSNLEKINGFIMGYNMSRPNGFKMETEVTSIEVNPAIEDKVFEIPKGYDIKPMSEMQQFFNRRFNGGSPPSQ
ncbi:MAG: hypothetical protein BGP13_00310 [Sphingobacteriales bacterium 40-81]|nr:MAG: hypothetical protein BGP13_00310 [Sphingobacteriales bacterium 40-81]